MCQHFLENELKANMDQKSIEKVNLKIYQRFPNLAKKKPQIAKQSEGRYLLIYSGSGTTPDGKQIQQKVRVVATEDGRIINTSMSR